MRYVARTGQISFASADSRFWVVRLEGRVREYLQLDAKNVEHGLPALHVPPGRAGTGGTIAARFTRPVAGYIDITPYYCILGTAKGAAALPPPG